MFNEVKKNIFAMNKNKNSTEKYKAVIISNPVTDVLMTSEMRIRKWLMFKSTSARLEIFVSNDLFLPELNWKLLSDTKGSFSSLTELIGKGERI